MDLVMKGAHRALLRTSHKSCEAICDADIAGTGKKVILISVLHYDNLCRTVWVHFLLILTELYFFQRDKRECLPSTAVHLVMLGLKSSIINQIGKEETGYWTCSLGSFINHTTPRKSNNDNKTNRTFESVLQGSLTLTAEEHKPDQIKVSCDAHV